AAHADGPDERALVEDRDRSLERGHAREADQPDEPVGNGLLEDLRRDLEHGGGARFQVRDLDRAGRYAVLTLEVEQVATGVEDENDQVAVALAGGVGLRRLGDRLRELDRQDRTDRDVHSLHLTLGIRT